MSSPTVALVRKDRPWLLAFLVLGTALSASVFLEPGFTRVFVVPEARFAEDLELVLVPCAVLLALVASLGETLRSTRDLLRHRPLSAARVSWTRHLAALAVIGAWTVLGALALWLQELASGAGGACADASRFGALAALAAGLMLDYAVIVLALSLPTAWFHRAWIAGVLLFLRYAAQSSLSFLDPSWSACLLAFALGTWSALALAARCEATGHDADLPTPDRALWGAGAVCVAGAAFFGAVGMSGWQKLAFEGLWRGRPFVGRVGENELGLLAPPDSEGQHAVLDERGEPTGLGLPHDDEQHHPPPETADADFEAFSIRTLHPPHAWYQGRPPHPRRIRILEDALRVVEETRLNARRCWTLALPAGTTGTRGAGFVELEDGGKEPLFFLAPGVGLWHVTDETPPRLVAQTLPEGDRPARLDYARDESGEMQRVLAGASGSWRYRAGAWQAVPRTADEVPVAFAVLDDDPLRPEVEVRLASGVALRHRYGLERAREKLFAGWAMLGSILRPPPFALLGAWTDHAAVAQAEPDEALLVLDPLLGGGHRWLLVPNLALTAACMALVSRDLRRRGASSRRRLGWTLAVLVGGIFTGPVLLVLEPRRAWRRPARETPPAPLIRAA